MTPSPDECRERFEEWHIREYGLPSASTKFGKNRFAGWQAAWNTRANQHVCPKDPVHISSSNQKEGYMCSKCMQIYLVEKEPMTDRQIKAVSDAIISYMERPDNWGISQYADMAVRAISASDAHLVPMLVEVIKDTLEENGHLADGEVCTLIKLKRALQALPEEYRRDKY